MQFIDLAGQQKRIKDRIDQNIQNVLGHGRYILGPEVADLEARLAAYAGTEHAVGCSSGTDALLLALMAYGIGPGDAVLTSPFTFIATAEVITLLGATPVFVDIDPATFNLDPNQFEATVQDIQRGRSALTPKVVMPVDLFGLPADYDAVNDIARQHGLVVIEDAAQSFGGEYKGQKACSLGHIGCTSFFPAKPLGGYGDGGMCFTSDAGLAETMRSLLVHGQGRDKYENVRIGINGRLDTLQAAVLLAKFEIFPDEVARRQAVASKYTELISEAAPELRPPRIPDHSLSAWAQYTVLARDEAHRKAAQAKLKDQGIPTAVYYPTPLHLQPAFAGLPYQAGDFPVSEDCSRRVFSLPMHPYLEEADQQAVASALAGL